MKEEEQGYMNVARQEEQEKKPEETRQTSRVTWLGLGEEWGVVRDVRKMIYKMLTPLGACDGGRKHTDWEGLLKDTRYTCANGQHNEDIWEYFDGLVGMVVNGMKKFARLQQGEAILRC